MTWTWWCRRQSKERRGDRGRDSLTGGRLTQGRQSGVTLRDPSAGSVKRQISPSRPVTDLHPRTQRLLLYPLLLFLSVEGKFFFLSFFQLNKISWHGSFASERRNPSRESNHSFLSNFWQIVFVSMAKKKKKENGQYVPLLKRDWRWTQKAFFCLFPTLLCQNLQWKVHEEKPRSDPRVLASHLPFWHVEQVQACQLPLGLEMWQICQKQRLLDLSRLENGPAGCASTSEASAWFVFQSSWGCLFVVDTKPLKLWSICMWEAGTS